MAQVGVDVLPDGTIVERFAEETGKPALSHDVLRSHNAPHPSSRDRVVTAVQSVLAGSNMSLTQAGSNLQVVPSLNFSRLDPRTSQMTNKYSERSDRDPMSSRPSSFRSTHDGAKHQESGIRASSQRTGQPQDTTGELRS
jgi:hypothetical protein